MSPSPLLRDVGSVNVAPAPSQASLLLQLPLPFPKGCGQLGLAQWKRRRQGGHLWSGMPNMVSYEPQATMFVVVCFPPLSFFHPLNLPNPEATPPLQPNIGERAWATQHRRTSDSTMAKMMHLLSQPPPQLPSLSQQQQRRTNTGKSSPSMTNAGKSIQHQWIRPRRRRGETLRMGEMQRRRDKIPEQP
jgi:hypothetical protein